jgi:hypothetical protein
MLKKNSQTTLKSRLIHTESSDGTKGLSCRGTERQNEKDKDQSSQLEWGGRQSSCSWSLEEGKAQET